MKTTIFCYRKRCFMLIAEWTEVDVFEENGKYYAQYTYPVKEEGFKHSETCKIEVSADVINKIKAVYKDNASILELEEVDFPPILDGSSNEFTFGYEDKEHTIDASNIWYYDGNTEEGSDDVKQLIKVFKMIKNILIKAGVEKKSLKLK